MPNSGLPKSMTSIAIREPGGPDMLVPQQQPVPAPGEGENPSESRRRGREPAGRDAAPRSLSAAERYDRNSRLEIAGEVAQVGPGVTRWDKGDKVMALVVGGGYAEYCLAFASHALPVPASLSMIEAAAIPETFFTVGTTCSSAASSPPAKPCSCTAAHRASAPQLFSSARRSALASS
jgi:NADPH:quinone reductase